MTSSEVVLYDIPSRNNGGAWSLNPWKPRASLNFKKMAYRTEWVEYPDIAPTFESLGIAPNAKGVPYTAPAARLPDGSHVMESLAIVRALEALQPEPSLHVESEYVERTQVLVSKIFGALYGIAGPRVPERLLPQRSATYFYETREKSLGKPLDDYGAEFGGQRAWDRADERLRECVEMLKENDGPFVLGETPSFADLILGGLWRCLERVDDAGDLAGRALGYDPILRVQWEACKPWFERAD